MTPEKLKAIISQGEGTEVELKESKDSLAGKVYESICALLNRRGGHVVLGVDNVTLNCAVQSRLRTCLYVRVS